MLQAMDPMRQIPHTVSDYNGKSYFWDATDCMFVHIPQQLLRGDRSQG